MENKLEVIQKLEEAGMTEEMLALYRHCCDTDDAGGRESLLRRFCRIKKQALAEDRQKLFCLDYLMAKIENWV